MGYTQPRHQVLLRRTPHSYHSDDAPNLSCVPGGLRTEFEGNMELNLKRSRGGLGAQDDKGARGLTERSFLLTTTTTHELLGEHESTVICQDLPFNASTSLQLLALTPELHNTSDSLRDRAFDPPTSPQLQSSYLSRARRVKTRSRP
ncbi:hypothetical protein NMY22_g14454 [Coprinellus aureogranulatus]|nr:hypothetical protein NMY22_g14454 [Coprinellus aureogranulatus]